MKLPLQKKNLTINVVGSLLGLTSKQKELLELIAENGVTTESRKQIGEKMGIGKARIGNLLKELKDKGVVDSNYKPNPKFNECSTVVITCQE